MTLVIWGVVAILLILIAMRLPATADFLLTSMKPTSERRRRKEERRKRSVPTVVDRRRRPRRLEDVAAWYVDRISADNEAQNSQSK